MSSETVILRCPSCDGKLRLTVGRAGLVRCGHCQDEVQLDTREAGQFNGIDASGNNDARQKTAIKAALFHLMLGGASYVYIATYHSSILKWDHSLFGFKHWHLYLPLIGLAQLCMIVSRMLHVQSQSIRNALTVLFIHFGSTLLFLFYLAYLYDNGFWDAVGVFLASLICSGVILNVLAAVFGLEGARTLLAYLSPGVVLMSIFLLYDRVSWFGALSTY